MEVHLKSENGKISVFKDFTSLERGEISQFMAELEVAKKELCEIYDRLE